MFRFLRPLRGNLLQAVDDVVSALKIEPVDTTLLRRCLSALDGVVADCSSSDADVIPLALHAYMTSSKELASEVLPSAPREQIERVLEKVDSCDVTLIDAALTAKLRPTTLEHLFDTQSVQPMSVSQRVHFVRLLSVAASRRLIENPPPLGNVLRSLADEKLSGAQILTVLISLDRLQVKEHHQAIHCLTRRAIPALMESRPSLIASALHSALFLPENSVDDEFLRAVLRELIQKAHMLCSRSIGDVCYSLVVLRRRKHESKYAKNAALVVRLLPEVLTVAEKCPEFSLRDASRVMCCFRLYGVRNGALFSKLAKSA